MTVDEDSNQSFPKGYGAVLTLLVFGLLNLFCAGPSNISRISIEDDFNPVEISVAINPVNPRNVVGVGMKVGLLEIPSISNFSYHTFDGGESWNQQMSANPDGRVQGDDAVVFDKTGRLFHSYISFSGLREENPENPRNGIFLKRSFDGGVTWDEPVAVLDHPGSLEPFEDKPYLVADRSESTFENRLYISWTRFDKYLSDAPGDSSRILLSYSIDEGKSFSPPVIVSDKAGDCLDSDETVEGAVPAIGPNGNVYIAWASSDGIMFDRSVDGGQNFGIDKLVYNTPGGWDISINGISRHNGMPVTKVDLSEGPQNGRIYISWIDTRNGDPDIFLGYSDDQGESWSIPNRVNGDQISNGKEQFFSWMAVDPEDGSVNLVYFDRSGLGSTQTKLTLARSVDGGKSFEYETLRIEPFATNPDLFFGDYIGIDAFNGMVVAAFPHFLSESSIAVSAARFNFIPGTQTQSPN